MRKRMLVVLALAAMMCLAAVPKADAHVGISIGIPLPGVYIGGPAYPAYYAPPVPVYYGPPAYPYPYYGYGYAYGYGYPYYGRSVVIGGFHGGGHFHGRWGGGHRWGGGGHWHR